MLDPQSNRPYTPLQQDASFQLQREAPSSLFSPREFLTSLETEFPYEIELLKHFSMHPESTTTVINFYTQEPLSNSFVNIGDHSTAVAFAASRIADTVLRAKIITEVEHHWIVSHALVHDLSKPLEIMRRMTLGANASASCYSAEGYHAAEEVLLKNGFKDSEAQFIIDSGFYSGHLHLRELITPSDAGFDLREGLLTHKIVHLADDLTHTHTSISDGVWKSEFVDIDTRYELGNIRIKYPHMTERGLGVYPDGLPDEVLLAEAPNNIRILGSYEMIQKRVAHLICDELKSLIAPDSLQNSMKWVIELIDER